MVVRLFFQQTRFYTHVNMCVCVCVLKMYHFIISVFQAIHHLTSDDFFDLFQSFGERERVGVRMRIERKRFHQVRMMEKKNRRLKRREKTRQ